MNDRIRLAVPSTKTVMLYQTNRQSVRYGMTPGEFHVQAMGFNNCIKNKQFGRKRFYIMPARFQTPEYLQKDGVHLRQDDVDGHKDDSKSRINCYRDKCYDLFDIHVIDDLYHG